MTTQTRERMLARIPTGRFITPEEVAAAVVFLASPGAALDHRPDAGRGRRVYGELPADAPVCVQCAYARTPVAPGTIAALAGDNCGERGRRAPSCGFLAEFPLICAFRETPA